MCTLYNKISTKMIVAAKLKKDNDFSFINIRAASSSFKEDF